MSSKDYTPLITSQHAGQPNFVATVGLTANGVSDITAALESLPALFDLNAAIGSQLDIDGQWVGFARTVGGVLLVQFFGFADDSSALGFGELGNPAVGGRFYELGADTSSTANLQDPEYRLLLQAKILQNTWKGDVASFETAIADVIQLPTNVIDPGTSVVLIAPSAAVDPVLSQLLTSYDLLPRAAGVRYQYVFPMSGYAWNLVGTATAPSITTLRKLSGTNAWDSSAYVANPAAHVLVEWTVPDTTHDMMGGLATNPSGSPSYPSLNFGLYNNGGGIVQVYESGVSQGSFGTYAAGDSFGVYYDGKEAVYLHNGAPFKTTISTPGALSAMFCLYTLGSEIDNISIATG